MNSIVLGKDYKFFQNIFNTISCNKVNSINIIKYQDSEINLDRFLKSNNIDAVFIDIDTMNVSILDYFKNNSKIKVIIFSDNIKSINYIVGKYKVYNVFSRKFDQKLFNNCIDFLINNPIRTSILQLLNNFNFNKSTKGYKYIFSILEYCIYNNIKSINSMKELYSKINDIYKYECKPIKIEWNIAKTIKTMITLTDEDVIKKYFKYNIYPSSKCFINGILEYYFTFNY